MVIQFGCLPWSINKCMLLLAPCFSPQARVPFLLRKHTFIDLFATEVFPVTHHSLSVISGFWLPCITPLFPLAQSVVRLQPQRERITGLTLSTHCFSEPCPALLWTQCRVSIWCFQIKETNFKLNSQHKAHRCAPCMRKPREERSASSCYFDFGAEVDCIAHLCQFPYWRSELLDIQRSKKEFT